MTTKPFDPGQMERCHGCLYEHPVAGHDEPTYWICEIAVEYEGRGDVMPEGVCLRAPLYPTQETEEAQAQS